MNTNMRNVISFVKILEGLTKVKTLHNEFIILSLLDSAGTMPSLQIMRETGRSISGHNADMKRLRSLGLIELADYSEDKRLRVFRLTEKARHCINAANNEAMRTMAAPPDARPAIGADWLSV